MEWGSKLHPGNVFIFCLLSRNDISQEVGPGEEPTTTEDVEGVEDRKVDNLRKRLPRSSPPFHSRTVRSLEGCRRAEDEGTTCLGAGEGEITGP